MRHRKPPSEARNLAKHAVFGRVLTSREARCNFFNRLGRPYSDRSLERASRGSVDPLPLPKILRKSWRPQRRFDQIFRAFDRSVVVEAVFETGVARSAALLTPEDDPSEGSRQRSACADGWSLKAHRRFDHLTRTAARVAVLVVEASSPSELGPTCEILRPAPLT
jgi:hypothetical protein